MKLLKKQRQKKRNDNVCKTKKTERVRIEKYVHVNEERKNRLANQSS